MAFYNRCALTFQNIYFILLKTNNVILFVGPFHFKERKLYY